MIGWIGMALALYAYYELAVRKNMGSWPLWVNIVASILLGYENYTHGVIANVFLNATWAVVGGMGIYARRIQSKDLYDERPSSRFSRSVGQRHRY